MQNKTEQNRLITHAISPENIEICVQETAERIKQQHDDNAYTLPLNKKLELLQQLTEFDFGRFLLKNKGVNGYWTHYMTTHPWFGRKTKKNNRGEAFTPLESFMLDRAPSMLATQQRLEIFLKENQTQVKNNATLACIPCGMMGELLYLDYKDVSHIRLVGIDYDADTFNDAKFLAVQRNLALHPEFIQADAWQLNLENEFDLISSNGLNFYEPNHDKITKLYAEFYKALKPGGKLVTSFLTYLPSLTDECEWDLSKVNKDDVLLQKVVFMDIIQGKFQCYRSSQQTQQQLEQVGFKDVRLIYDEARIFPTVVAYK